MNDGRSMRALKDSPVTRLFRNHLRTSGREASKIGHLTAQTSPRIRSIHDGLDKNQRGNSARSTRAVEESPSRPVPAGVRSVHGGGVMLMYKMP